MFTVVPSMSVSNNTSFSPDKIIKNQTSSIEIINTTYSIVVTQPFIQDFVQNIVGNLFSVSSIVKGTQDPHSYTPTIKDTLAVSEANIFIYFGVADIDGWAAGIISSIPSSVHVVKLVDLTKDGLYDPYIGSGELNPHLWMWPSFVNSTLIQRIYNTLVKYDPTHTAIYTSNLQAYREHLKGLIMNVAGNATILKNVEFVEYHAAYFYLLHEMNLTRLGAVEQIEDQEPSAVHFTNITNIIKSEVSKGKEVVLVQSLNIPPDTTWQIARDTGAKIAYVAALLGSYKSATFTNYIQMIEYDLFALTHPESPPPVSLPSFELPYILFILSFLAVIEAKRKRNTS